MSKYDSKINEMLMILNAIPKKDGKKKEGKKDLGIDPVMQAMNSKLDDFGMHFGDEEDDIADETDDTEEIEGSFDTNDSDIDIARPESEDEEAEEDGESSGGNPFDFLNVGRTGTEEDVPMSTEDEEVASGEIGDGENALKFEYDKKRGAVISIDGKEVVLSKEQIPTILGFLSNVSGKDAESFDDEGSDDEAMEMDGMEGYGGMEGMESNVSINIPLLLRMFEFAKEDAKSDMELHHAIEKIISLGAERGSLTMDDYEEIVNGCGEEDSEDDSDDDSEEDKSEDDSDEEDSEDESDDDKGEEESEEDEDKNPFEV